jgi:hypothetical protein
VHPWQKIFVKIRVNSPTHRRQKTFVHSWQKIFVKILGNSPTHRRQKPFVHSWQKIFVSIAVRTAGKKISASVAKDIGAFLAKALPTAGKNHS